MLRAKGHDGLTDEMADPASFSERGIAARPPSVAYRRSALASSVSVCPISALMQMERL